MPNVSGETELHILRRVCIGPVMDTFDTWRLIIAVFINPGDGCLFGPKSKFEISRVPETFASYLRYFLSYRHNYR